VLLLLDTCAAIWLAEGQPMKAPSIAAIERAVADGDVRVSPVTAWEIGMLCATSRLVVRPSPQDWFARLLERPGVQLAPLTPEVAIEASFLPGKPHGDPADRLLVATARQLGAALVTRDRRILDYAASGNVKAMAC
jgi:PIN domain nuclease of toxin-antitoxin system